MNAKEIRSILDKASYVSGSYSSLEEYKNDIESLLAEALRTLETEDSIQVKQNSKNELYSSVMLSKTELENSLMCVQYVEKKLENFGIERADLTVLSIILRSYLQLAKRKAPIEASGIIQ